MVRRVADLRQIRLPRQRTTVEGLRRSLDLHGGAAYSPVHTDGPDEAGSRIRDRGCSEPSDGRLPAAHQWTTLSSVQDDGAEDVEAAQVAEAVSRPASALVAELRVVVSVSIVASSVFTVV